METAATLLALLIGLMALVRFYSKKNNTFLFIGAGFLGTALLDGYHAVVTSSGFGPFMPSDQRKALEKRHAELFPTDG